ncbi:MAG: hypothetical protein A2Z72_07495 [Omnitrophica bacterium RBG_13_46_9]|nr:MAG: hypothetical protein A2Z72_07495 [Omnitrophica bacterium RBG_13_46_9]
MSAVSENISGVAHRTLVKTMFVISFVIMTALGAYVRIPLPFSPVPITLQTFFVFLCGAVLGKKLGGFTQFSYVFLGAIGVPVFQGYGSGFPHILGPTGGYLAGFIVASCLIGAVMDRGRHLSSFSYIIFAMSVGVLAIYTCGVAWLMVGYKFSFVRGISSGFIPFIPGAVVKLITAAWVYLKIRPRTDLLIHD